MRIKKIIISLVLFTVLFTLLACGAGTPEQQARMIHEHGQRFEAEMERIEREGLEPKEEKSTSSNYSFVLLLMIFVAGMGVGALARDRYGNWNQDQFEPSLIDLLEYEKSLLHSRKHGKRPVPVRPIPNTSRKWTESEMQAMPRVKELKERIYE
jgi:hypothetical protein